MRTVQTTAAAVRAALRAAGYAPSNRSRRGTPTVGFVVTTPATGAHVKVSATMGGLLGRYRDALTRAGYEVSEQHGVLLVSTPPQEG